MTHTPTPDEAIELPIAACEVAQVVVSRFVPRLQLVFFGCDVGGGRKSDCRLALDGQFDLAAGEGELRIDPAAPTPVVLELVSKRVQRAVAEQDGTLRLSFIGGGGLTVAPGEYEPWQFFSETTVDEDGWLVVSVAGGGLSAWFPDLT
jgi:hypothetical protein